ncbi:MAG: hypothetical protein LBQ54_00205, partial [Planctomycetaceae bacterium]|nr:hypothetical protein [Planctomycetaceae bacterium]
KGDWKLIKPHIDKEPQLYNLAADVGEQTDLAEQEQERYRELLTLWNEWNTQNEPERWHDPRSEGDGPGRNVKVRQNKAEITPDTTFGMKLKFDFHQGPG